MGFINVQSCVISGLTICYLDSLSGIEMIREQGPHASSSLVCLIPRQVLNDQTEWEDSTPTTAAKTACARVNPGWFDIQGKTNVSI